jgi:ATP-dependent exoDNAse (exonuclease V) beta subunit
VPPRQRSGKTLDIRKSIREYSLFSALSDVGNTISWPSLRRETPVLLRRADGTLIEGIVDLAFREDTQEFNGWTVVDFKTDRELEPNRSQYAAQVGLYVEAIADATTLPTRGVLLVV